MKPHDTFLELAAVAIDFPLRPADRSRMEQHLAACAACAHSVAAFRADAVAIASTPVPALPERRGAGILSDALHPATGRPLLRTALIVALLGLLLVGSLAAGSWLIRDMEQYPLVVVPPLPSVSASPAATMSPAATAPAASADTVVPLGILAVTHGDETSAETGATWVELVTPETGAVSPLGFGRDPAWLGDGRLVYACAKELGENTTICMVDATQEYQPEIASGATQPAPAPDGGFIAVHRGSIDVGETWLLRPDGKDLHRLAAGSFLQWSPDGTWLVGQPKSATFEVAIVAVTGGPPRVLASGYDPAWSPSGDAIAYALVDAQGPSLRVVNPATGASQIRFTAAAPSELTAPAWLPDGRLVFVLDGALYRLDAGSSEPVRLTTGLAIRADWFGDALAVSPDGRSIAFSSGSGADARVGIASVDGGSRWLDLGSGPITQPQWAPASATPLDQRFVGPSIDPG